MSPLPPLAALRSGDWPDPTPAAALPPARLAAVLLVAPLLVLACAHAPSQTEERATTLTDRAVLGEFVGSVVTELESGQWEALLSRAEPGHRRTQTVEMGMPEPQYVAELFGLHRVGNSLAPEGPVRWEDLERIESVRTERLERVDGRWELGGRVGLDDGTTLDFEAWIVGTEEAGYVLTGGVG